MVEAGDRIRLLLVDDDEDLVLLLGDVLPLWGYAVTAASNGDRAIELLRDAAPSILIVDFGLPDRSGLEVAAFARRTHGGTMAIVGITGFGGQTIKARAMAAGCDVVLVKPFGTDRLRRELERLCPRAPVA